MSLKLDGIPYLMIAIWIILGGATLFAALTQHWSNVFVTATALVLTVLPPIIDDRFNIHLPMSFLAAISLFVFGTLFLGEVFDFYNRYWWWDILLHGASAAGFGIIGFLFVFYLFQGDKYDAPPWALAMFAFSFALAIGALWEIFEFGMDQLFGLNMQKSGLVDTMADLIVDTLGAFLGAFSGFVWLKGRDGYLSSWIGEFIETNRSLYRRFTPNRKDKGPDGRG